MVRCASTSVSYEVYSVFIPCTRRCACVDSYRALVLRPSWEKAYYRCAEAWAKMGELPEALAINQAGLRACSEHPDLVKQLRELQGIISGRYVLKTR